MRLTSLQSGTRGLRRAGLAMGPHWISVLAGFFACSLSLCVISVKARAALGVDASVCYEHRLGERES